MSCLIIIHGKTQKPHLHCFNDILVRILDIAPTEISNFSNKAAIIINSYNQILLQDGNKMIWYESIRNIYKCNRQLNIKKNQSKLNLLDVQNQITETISFAHDNNLTEYFIFNANTIILFTKCRSTMNNTSTTVISHIIICNNSECRVRELAEVIE